ncbi:MAG: hypothetical protein ACREP2_11070, partial [Rhodanobacteraceae bacterium]
MPSTIEIEATKAKTRFAALTGEARRRDVAITRHGRIEAYVLSPERYGYLTAVADVGEDVMHDFRDRFDALYRRMQTQTQTRAMARIAAAPLAEILAAGAPARRAAPK